MQLMQEYAPKNFVVLQFTNQEYESLSHEMCDLKVKGVLTEMAQLKFFLHMLLHRLLELLFLISVFQVAYIQVKTAFFLVCGLDTP